MAKKKGSNRKKDATMTMTAPRWAKNMLNKTESNIKLGERRKNTPQEQLDDLYAKKFLWLDINMMIEYFLEHNPNYEFLSGKEYAEKYIAQQQLLLEG